MADLNISSNGIVDFEMLVNELDPLQISEEIHNGLGTGTLIAAEESWQRNVNIPLAQLANNHKDLLSTMTESWSGPAAQEMQKALTSYGDWLSEMAASALRMRNCCNSLRRAFETARDVFIVKPQAIKDNREKLEILLDDPLGRNSAQVFELEEEYEEWEITNRMALLQYYSTAARVAAKLPSFPEPPRQPDQPNSRGWWQTIGEALSSFPSTIVQAFVDWLCQLILDNLNDVERSFQWAVPA